jgi:hypothetical protein
MSDYLFVIWILYTYTTFTFVKVERLIPRFKIGGLSGRYETISTAKITVKFIACATSMSTICYIYLKVGNHVTPQKSHLTHRFEEKIIRANKEMVWNEKWVSIAPRGNFAAMVGDSRQPMWLDSGLCRLRCT